jgi:hypothetical protein
MTTQTLERPVVAPTLEPADPDELVVVVRQEHIDRGVRSQAASCPIALAARAAGHGGVMFAGLWIGQTQWYSEEAVEFVRTFDRGDTVYPERFVFRRAA